MRKDKFDMFYGFEDYDIASVDSSCFEANKTIYYSHWRHRNSENYIIEDTISIKANYDNYDIKGFDPMIGENHTELLKTAKSLYVHPSCKLSRSMLTTKYKKSLNPWTADAVVIPEWDINKLDFKDVVLFVNENAKILVLIPIYAYDGSEVKKYVDTLKNGTKFKDAILGDPSMIGADIMESELFYRGKILIVSSNYQQVYDILTGGIPNNKTVFENSVLASLANDENKVTFENLTSIKDMLESTDKETVSAALKSLSMMDWMHYPNSIRYILEFDFRRNSYNPAMNSTSVRYMIKTLNGRRSIRSLGNFDYSIYEEDYDLFIRLKKYYGNLDDSTILNVIKFMNFMNVNAEGSLCPNIKAKET